MIQVGAGYSCAWTVDVSVMHTYGWHERRRDFERTRGTIPSVKKSASKAAEVGVSVVAEEKEYA